MDVYKNKNFPGSPPFKDSNDYPTLEDIDYEKLVLTSDKMSDEQRTLALNEFEKYIITQKNKFLGYQANQKLDYQSDLGRFLDSHINNIGDPFQSGNFTVNSKIIERAVLDYFASLWHAKWPHLEKDKTDKSWKKTYWGYVLSMGSSEGNIYALWNARDYLSGKFLLKDTVKTEKARKSTQDKMIHSAAPRYKRFSAKVEKDNINAYTPIAFYSENTHYSIIKNMRILGITTFYDEAVKKGYECPLDIKKDGDYPVNYSPQYIGENGWPYEVPSNDDGSVYIHALTKLVEFFAKLGYPPMLIFNYGSTFKGALDNVEKAVDSLRNILKKNNLYKRKIQYGKDKEGNPLFDKRTGFWVHVDGALGAGYAPYLKKQGENDAPIFDFRIKELHSITMSGHKWIGAPWPCGIFMTKGKYQLLPVDNPAYIGSSDSTFSGSRNGFSSLILWDFIAKHSLEDLSKRAEKATNLAKYFMEKFKAVETFHRKNLWLEYSPNAITVRFKKVNDDIIFKYSLSSESLFVNGEKRDYNHIFLMDLVSENLIDEFIMELKTPNAFPVQKSELSSSNGDSAEDEDFDSSEFVMGLGLGFK